MAYFVAEYALSSDAPTYAGGLGVLAGDYLLEAAKENFPFILVSLLYRGYDASKDGYEAVLDDSGTPIVVSVPLEKRKIMVKAWTKSFGPSTKSILLDTDTPENSSEDRQICAELYDSHIYTRICQQIILGLAGVEFLEQLGVYPRIYHVNEGHTSLTSLAIIRQEMVGGNSFESACAAARAKTVFTKHTILSGSGLYIPSDEFFRFVDGYCAAHGIDSHKVFEIGEFEDNENMFSTTRFGVRMSSKRNAVSAIHLKKEKEIHPASEFIFVTNGIFKDRWDLLRFPKDASDKDIWDAKISAKRKAIEQVGKETNIILDPEALTIVWARRFAEYKRPRLLFADLSRLAKILSEKNRPAQIIISGKAHPSDEEAKKTVEMIRTIIAREDFRAKIAYVPEYSLDIASTLIAAADVWLNTPERGFEACGTSGMKAGLNGALMCSISDGWMDEVDWSLAGWILPEEKTADVLYDFLEKEISPEFFRRAEDGAPPGWISRIRKTISIVETGFGAERMLADYRKKMYFL